MSQKPQISVSSETRPKRRLDFFSRNPVASAVSTKLIDDIRLGAANSRSNRRVDTPDIPMLERFTDQTTTNINDAANTLEILPDLTLAKQILVSSILSPNDLMNTDLTYKVAETPLNGELTGALLTTLKEYFDKTYKIEEMCPAALEDALFKTGSYPLMIVPESTLDDLINSRERVSVEALRAETDHNNMLGSIGILGPAPTEKETKSKPFAKQFSLGMESLFDDHGITPNVDGEIHPGLFVTDNPSAVKVPKIVEKMSHDRVRDALQAGSVSLESRRSRRGTAVTQHLDRQRSFQQMEQSLYSKRAFQSERIVGLVPGDAATRSPVGHPLIMKLPAECIIPVHVPSNPDNHVGYFVLLDEYGNPLIKAEESDYYKQMSDRTNFAKDRSGKSAVSELLRQVKGFNVGGCDPDRADANEIMLTYTRLVEQQLLTRLYNGVYGKTVEISRPQEVYRIMFARALARKCTQVLYVPVELMTYVAFDYNRMGMGKSLLDGTKILSSIRAMLLFTNLMAMMKNSISRTKLNITLDPDDPDPAKTVEDILNEYARTTNRSLPLATTNPLDIVDGIRAASIDVVVKGNPMYPETEVSPEDYASQRVLVDKDLDDTLKNRHLMAIGLSPEMVDSTMNVEFAASILNSNLLFTKRIAMYQRVFSGFLQDFIRKYTKNSGFLMRELHRILNENRKLVQQFDADSDQQQHLSDGSLGAISPEELGSKDDEYILDLFLNAVEVELPAPDTAKLESQLAAFNTYLQSLEAALPAYVTPEILTALFGDKGQQNADAVIGIVKGYFIRQWLSRNKMLPELERVFGPRGTDDTPVNFFTSYTEHLENIGDPLMDLLKDFAAKHNKEDEAAGNDGDGGGSSWGSSDSGDSSWDNGGTTETESEDLTTDDFTTETEQPSDDTDTATDSENPELSSELPEGGEDTNGVDTDGTQSLGF